MNEFHKKSISPEDIPEPPFSGPIDEKSRLEAQDYDNQEKERVKLRELIKATLSEKEHEQKIRLIEDYANRLYCLILFWIFGVGGIVIFAGLKKIPFVLGTFGLPKAVLIALLTSTTASVLALFHYVGRYIFGAPHERSYEARHLEAKRKEEFRNGYNGKKRNRILSGR